MRRIALAFLVVVMIGGQAHAKDKAKPRPVEKEQIGNWLDLRDETFVCLPDGCGMPVRGILIACGPDACRPVTDIIVSSGPVKRIIPPQSDPAPVKPK